MDARFPRIRGTFKKSCFLFSGVALSEVLITRVSTSFWVVGHEDETEKNGKSDCECRIESKGFVAGGQTVRRVRRRNRGPLVGDELIPEKKTAFGIDQS